MKNNQLPTDSASQSRTAVARCKPRPLSRKQRRLGYAAAIVSALTFGSMQIAPLSAAKTVLAGSDCVVEPSEVVNLGSAVSGLLASTDFDRSDFVSKGTVLATLESRVEEVTLAIAQEVAMHETSINLRQTAARFGERTRKRNQSLLKTASISQQNMDQVDTETRVARLQVLQELESQRLAILDVERARAALERRSIVTPIDGSIIKRFKSAGEYVDNEPVFQVAKLDPLHVEVIVPLNYLGSIETGMRAAVKLMVPGFEDRVLDAQVRRIDSVADAASSTYGVRLVLDNPELKIPSGVRCQVDIYAS